MNRLYSPYDPPEWLDNWAALHQLTIEEMSSDEGWLLFARDGTPSAHCYASWIMEDFLRSLDPVRSAFESRKESRGLNL